MKKLTIISYSLSLALLLIITNGMIWYIFTEYFIIPDIYKHIPKEVIIQNQNDLSKISEMVMKQYKFGTGPKLILMLSNFLIFILIGFLLEIKRIGFNSFFILYTAIFSIILFIMPGAISLDIALILWLAPSIALNFLGFYLGKLLSVRRKRPT